MSDYRIYVEKKPGFRVEAESLRKELNSNLGLKLEEVRLLNVYDLFGFTPELLEQSSKTVFGELPTDTVTTEPDLRAGASLATEYLPGQFDARANSARECIGLLDPDAKVTIRSGRLLLFNPAPTDEQMERIRHYIVNPVESRLKDMSRLQLPEHPAASPVETLTGFREITAAEADEWCKAKGLAMNGDDLMMTVEYFKEEGRDPREIELRILDTYWSDHCRHTTFSTILDKVDIEASPLSEEIQASLSEWKSLRKELGREEKPFCLMDLATIGIRKLRKEGKLDDMEVSEENNACSVFVDIDVDGKPERWLLQFKNETHNHPTEIEPFGGASTCLGGAIRDPLSGRAYVYQAMRVTGAGNIYASVKDTLPGKLPQRVISTRAAAGYSSYGNQIGLATTHVREIFHPGYTAKRLEVGAVVGAVKASDVRRESPAPGDVVLMFGGRTGRDGIGGATGSSKEHNVSSLEQCGSEVQKGNAPEERKIQRLFRRPEVTRLIKKSNDFGAGGVSVAIGELADSLDIYLDRVPVKYEGLNATELAISESQERMSVVVEAADKEEFEKYCAEENLEVTHVADITDTGYMRMYQNDQLMVNIRRSFIDTAGASRHAEACIKAPADTDYFSRHVPGKDLRERFTGNLSDMNVTSQKGLIEMFDSSIGRSTILMPFGGKTQGTETQVSVQKFPVGPHRTQAASMMAFGFNPFMMEKSPYIGASYSVVEALAKITAAGGDWSKVRFSFQEYFEKMSSPEAWGKPLSALLGALRMQLEFGLASIGGKDSMSGTFGEMHVPPALIAFGVVPVNATEVISPEFKKAGDRIYLYNPAPLKSGMPDTSALKDAYSLFHAMVKEGKVNAAYSPGRGGVAEALAKMSFGNRIGFKVTLPEEKIFNECPGAILFETTAEINDGRFIAIGETVAEGNGDVNGSRFTLDELFAANRYPFAEIYPDRTEVKGEVEKARTVGQAAEYPGEAVEHPLVVLPVFPGTNCDYDMQKAFASEGARTEFIVFRNLDADGINESSAALSEAIDRAHILAVSGGFSAGDEPDGSGKFIASVLTNRQVRSAIDRLVERGGLVVGICNGFQALVKSGLLPYGVRNEVTEKSPTLFRNDINRHISQIVSTRLGTVASPWLSGFNEGEIFQVAASHGEGKFTCSKEMAEDLFRRGMVAFQYVGPDGNPTMESPWNPNGSTMAIEGIISPDGQILGKMAHSERYEDGLMINIPGNRNQNIFRNAINYFRKNK